MLLLVVLREELVAPQKLLRSSLGEGGRQTPESLISVWEDQLGARRIYGAAFVDLPLNLYSGCFSPWTSILGKPSFLSPEGTLVRPGRAFSSCLRNGLRMIGMVAEQCC